MRFICVAVPDWTMLIVLFPAQIAIVMILLINGFEFTGCCGSRAGCPVRPAQSAAGRSATVRLDPSSMLQQAAEMVILTLDSLAALEYDNYEVLVLDSNTRKNRWRPVEEHCAKLGAKFRLPSARSPGFKAGAGFPQPPPKPGSACRSGGGD
jgi:hypothetical protein